MFPHLYFQTALVDVKNVKDAGDILNRLQYPYIQNTSVSGPEVDRLKDWLIKGSDKEIEDVVFSILRKYRNRNAIDLMLYKKKDSLEIKRMLSFAWGEEIPKDIIENYYRFFWYTDETTPMEWDEYIRQCGLQGVQEEKKWKEQAQKDPFIKLQWDLGMLPDIGLEQMLQTFVSLGSRATFRVLEEPYKYNPVELMKLGIRAGTLLAKVQAETQDENPTKQLELEMEATDFNDQSILSLKDLVGSEDVLDIDVALKNEGSPDQEEKDDPDDPAKEDIQRKLL